MPVTGKRSRIEQRGSLQEEGRTAMRFLELLGAMKRYVREELRPLPERGMSEEKFRSLLGLKALGRSPLKALAAHDGLSPSAQCLMLDRLVDDGFARRSRDHEDRRRVLYELSEQGSAVLGSEIDRRSGILTDRLARLSAEERERFAKAVELLIASIVKIENKR